MRLPLTRINWTSMRSSAEFKMMREVRIRTHSCRNARSWTSWFCKSYLPSKMLNLHSRVSWPWLRIWRFSWIQYSSTKFQLPGPNLLSQVQEVSDHGSITWSIVSTSSTSGKRTLKTFQEWRSSIDYSILNHSWQRRSRFTLKKSKQSWTSSPFKPMSWRNSTGSQIFLQSKKELTSSVSK